MTIKLTKDSIDLGIVVRDAGKALAFYRDTLGLEHSGTEQLPGGGTLHWLRCGRTFVKLLDHGVELSASAPPGGLRAAYGYRYWTISVPNVDELAASCEYAGYTIAIAPRDVRRGIRISMIEDPDGNWVELQTTTPAP